MTKILNPDVDHQSNGFPDIPSCVQSGSLTPPPVFCVSRNDGAEPEEQQPLPVDPEPRVLLLQRPAGGAGDPDDVPHARRERSPVHRVQHRQHPDHHPGGERPGRAKFTGSFFRGRLGHMSLAVTKG